MSAFEEILDIQITRETAVLSRANFGIPLIIGDSTSGTFPVTDRIRTYGAGEVGDDFATTNPEYKAVSAIFKQAVHPPQVKVGRRGTVANGFSSNEDWDDALQAIRDVDDNFYGIALTTRTAADQKVVADALEDGPIKKILSLSSSDAQITDKTVTDGTDTSIAKQLYNLFFRSLVMFDPAAGGVNDQFSDASWLGAVLPTTPGAATWAYKNLVGVVPYNLTTTKRKNVLDKHANVYELIGGLGVTRDGTVSGGTAQQGEFIDTIRGVDWLHARMTERLFRQLTTLPKIPFTDAGINVVVGEVRAQLDEGIATGFLAADPAPKVTVPKRSQIGISNIGQRILSDVKFEATLAGAIHKVVIRGTVSL